MKHSKKSVHEPDHGHEHAVIQTTCDDITRWTSDIISCDPSEIACTCDENQDAPATQIHIRKHKRVIVVEIAKPMSKVTWEDVQHRLSKSLSLREKWQISKGSFYRFLGMWLASFSLIASSSVCPFCGQQGCPVGLTTAGFFGTIISALLSGARRVDLMLNFITSPFKRNKHTPDTNANPDLSPHDSTPSTTPLSHSDPSPTDASSTDRL